MITSLKQLFINAFGKKLTPKIVVIESDDWGSIRTTSNKEYDQYKKDFGSFTNPYLKYDTLASKDDLSALFDVLKTHKDQNGNHPVITFNTVVGNPDFDKIKESNFQKYFYEPFTETLNRYYPGANVFDLWKEAFNQGLIYPQFHGREHINVPVWLEQLQMGNKELLNVFDYGTWSTPVGKYAPGNIKLQAVFDYKGNQPIEYHKAFISEGLDLFESIFGFRSKTMIANNFVFPSNLNSLLKQSGVELVQGMKYQIQPYASSNSRKFTRRYFGQKDSNGLYFNIRNCSFEPSQTKDNYDDVGNCLKEIANAFFWKKPAVITTHRLNFIGAIDEDNRKRNLLKFKELLQAIKKNWPDVIFLDSSKFINILAN